MKRWSLIILVEPGGVGLIITEGTYPADNLGGIGYIQPGIANEKHQEAWKKIVDACHEHGAKIIAQLMHAGRVADPRTLRENESLFLLQVLKVTAGFYILTMMTNLMIGGYRESGLRLTFLRRGRLKRTIKIIANDFATAASRL